MADDPGTVTALLHRWQAGDATAGHAAMKLIYDELLRLAAGYLRHERPGHTLGPPALVAEAYLRLCGDAVPNVSDRKHFVAVSARIMRRVLVDYARTRSAEKRGGAAVVITLDESLQADAPPEALLGLDQALDQLGAFDPRAAEVIELIYFGGLDQAEVAEHLGLHVSTVARDLRSGEAWIRQRLQSA
jgi:RNA polymerase sigma factor (TIGR02999 family)